MSEKKQLNLLQKLAEIRNGVRVIKNNKRGYGYTYADEEEILLNITGSMASQGVSLIPGIVPGTTRVEPYSYSKTKTTKGGQIYEEKVNEILVHADTTWTWVDDDNPDDRIVVPWAMCGSQSDPSQAFGAGLTYSSRYFLLKYFNIATTDNDPDNFRSRQAQMEREADAIVASEIIAHVNSIVHAHLDKHPDDRSSLMSIICKYTGDKAGNYNKIKNSTTAANLLDELKKEFGGI